MRKKSEAIYHRGLYVVSRLRNQVVQGGYRHCSGRVRWRRQRKVVFLSIHSIERRKRLRVGERRITGTSCLGGQYKCMAALADHSISCSQACRTGHNMASVQGTRHQWTALNAFWSPPQQLCVCSSLLTWVIELASCWGSQKLLQQ